MSAQQVVIVCPICKGESVENADVGGLAYGGCPECDGTGLIHAVAEGDV